MFRLSRFQFADNTCDNFGNRLRIRRLRPRASAQYSGTFRIARLRDILALERACLHRRNVDENHYGVGGCDNFFQLIKRLALLDLRDRTGR